jgi:hypothetical protein
LDLAIAATLMAATLDWQLQVSWRDDWLDPPWLEHGRDLQLGFERPELTMAVQLELQLLVIQVLWKAGQLGRMILATRKAAELLSLALLAPPTCPDRPCYMNTGSSR